MSFRITIQNYRPFGEHPVASLTVCDGVTALVGPNNAGKTAVGKFFLEFRNLLGQLHTYNGLQTALLNGDLDSQPAEVADTSVVLNDSIADPKITVTFDFDILQAGPGITKATRATVTSTSTNPFRWKLVLDDLDLGTQGGMNGTKVLFRGAEQFDAGEIAKAFGLLSDSMYIGAKRSLAGSTPGDYYGLRMGELFVKDWHEFKNGDRRSTQTKVSQIEYEICALLGFDQLSINSSSDGKTLALVIDGKHRKLDEVGDGMAAVIQTLTTVAMREPALLFLDEPELHLHPKLQQEFVRLVSKYVRKHLLISTHSIGLARTVSEKCYVVTNSNVGARIELQEKASTYSQIVGEMGYGAFADVGFSHLLLVEGITDISFYNAILQKINKRDKVLVVPLGGDSMVCGGRKPQLEELKRICPNILAIVDSEKSEEGAAPKANHSDFVNDCNASGIVATLTYRRSTENYLVTRAIQVVMRSEAYSELGYFDSPAANFWGKDKNGEVAAEMTLDEFEGTDILQFLRDNLQAPPTGLQ